MHNPRIFYLKIRAPKATVSIPYVICQLAFALNVNIVYVCLS